MTPTLLATITLTALAASSPHFSSPSCRAPMRLRGGSDEAESEADDAAPEAAPAAVGSDATSSNATATAAPKLGRARGRARGRGAARGRGRGRGPPAAKRPAVQPTPSLIDLPAALRDLTEWKDPVRSGAVFGVGNVALGLTAMGRWSAASLLGAAAFFALLGCAAATLLVRFLGGFVPAAGVMLDAATAALPASLQLDNELLDAELAADAGRLLAGALNQGFAGLQRLATVADPAATAAAVLAAFVLKQLGGFVGVAGLLWAAFVAAFAVPLLKIHYGEQIGDAALQLRAQAEEAFAQLREQAVALVAPVMGQLGLGGSQ